MLKKVFSLVIILFLFLSLSACSFLKPKTSVKEFIIHNASTITNTLIDGSIDQIYNMFDTIDEDEKTDLLRFKNNLSMVKRVYVNAGAYEHSKGIDDGTSYESISTLQGIIVTDNNVYSYLVDFVVYDDTDLVIKKLWLISGRTEAVENKDWLNKYHFPGGDYKNAHIVYADYYDSYTSSVKDYKLIWGKVVEWNDSYKTYSISDFDKNDINSLPYNDIITKYGKPNAIYDTVGGYHFLFYKTNVDNKYIQLSLNDNDTIRKIKETDEIGYGITGITKIR